MIRVLFIIAAAGLLLAAVCFGGAAALGGREIVEKGWTVPADWVFYSETDAVDLGPQTTRDIEWSGAESLEFHVPVDIVFTQSDTPSFVITGPERAVNDIVVEGGRVTGLEDRPFSGVTFRDRPGVRLTISGPAVRAFALHGSQDLTIEGYDQDDLKVTIYGSGDVVARGRARTIELEIHGSGDADLSAVTSEDVEVMIAGSGEAEVAPTGHADIAIHGSGDVTLAARPARITQSIHGSGDVHQRQG